MKRKLFAGIGTYGVKFYKIIFFNDYYFLFKQEFTTVIMLFIKCFATFENKILSLQHLKCSFKYCSKLAPICKCITEELNYRPNKSDAKI